MFTTLAERLQHALDLAKMKPSALARACDVKQPSVSDWLTGRTMTMKADKLRLAAAALGVGRDWLETGKGPMLPANTHHATPPPAQAPAAKPDIGETVARLGELLGRADPKTRDTVAQLLLRYAQDPADGARIAQAIELLLRGCSEDDPATEP